MNSSQDNATNRDNPLISVITICWNAAGVIGRTLESVTSQTYPDFEYIVVDGGSKDGTRELVESYNGRISAFVSEKDRGIADAMNKGVRLSRGELIIHMHAGDTFHDSDVLSRIADDYRQNGWEWGFGGQVLCDAGGRVLEIQHPQTFHYRLLRIRNYVPHQAAVLTRKIFEQFGPFDISYRILMDYRFWLALGKDVQPRIFPFMVARFECGGTSYSDYVSSYREAQRARREVPWGAFPWRLREKLSTWLWHPTMLKMIQFVCPKRLRRRLRCLIEPDNPTPVVVNIPKTKTAAGRPRVNESGIYSHRVGS